MYSIPYTVQQIKLKSSPLVIAQFSGWIVCMVGTNRFFYLEYAEPDPGEESVDEHEGNSERHPAGVTQGCLEAESKKILKDQDGWPM
jgi:hypothetical protein